MTKLIKVCVDTIMAWAKIALKCANPLGLTEETLEETKEFAPPKVFKGGKYLGRYLVPDEFVRYDEKEQPRDKTNDPEHVNSLINSFTVNGYNLDANVPVAVPLAFVVKAEPAVDPVGGTNADTSTPSKKG